MALPIETRDPTTFTPAMAAAWGPFCDAVRKHQTLMDAHDARFETKLTVGEINSLRDRLGKARYALDEAMRDWIGACRAAVLSTPSGS
jgi:hypothetical protein